MDHGLEKIADPEEAGALRRKGRRIIAQSILGAAILEAILLLV